MQTSQTIKEIATALCKAQAAMQPAAKNSENPHFKSVYADLASVWAVIRGPLTDNGLSVIQNVITVESGVAIETQITHSSGEWYRFDHLIIPVNKRDAQGVGSAITYGKRYSLAAAVGVACDDDDDGERASGSPPERQRQENHSRNGRRPHNGSNGNANDDRKSKPVDETPPTTPPSELSQKDANLVDVCIKAMLATTTQADCDSVAAKFADPARPVANSDDPTAVRKAIWEGTKNHTFKPTRKPTLSAKDQAVVKAMVDTFNSSECQQYEDYMAIWELSKMPDSAISKADNPQLVRDSIMAAVKDHPFAKPAELATA